MLVEDLKTLVLSGSVGDYCETEYVDYHGPERFTLIVRRGDCVITENTNGVDDRWYHVWNGAKSLAAYRTISEAVEYLETLVPPVVEPAKKTKKTWSVEFYDIEHAPYPSIHTYVNATEEETIQEIFEGLREMYPACFIVETDTMTFPSKRDRWERYFTAYADTDLELSKVAEVRVTLNIRETTETKLCRLFDSLGF